jgi:hypothetical protein
MIHEDTPTGGPSIAKYRWVNPWTRTGHMWPVHRHSMGSMCLVTGHDSQPSINPIRPPGTLTATMSPSLQYLAKLAFILIYVCEYILKLVFITPPLPHTSVQAHRRDGEGSGGARCLGPFFGWLHSRQTSWTRSCMGGGSSMMSTLLSVCTDLISPVFSWMPH